MIEEEKEQAIKEYVREQLQTLIEEEKEQTVKEYVREQLQTRFEYLFFYGEEAYNEKYKDEIQHVQVNCGKVYNREPHSPHMWEFQREDDSPAVTAAYCLGYDQTERQDE